jgi:hypothetical protein
MQDDEMGKMLKERRHVMLLMAIYMLPLLPLLFSVASKDFRSWALHDLTVAPLYLIVVFLFLLAVMFHVMLGYFSLKKQSEPLQEWQKVKARCTRFSTFYFDPTTALYYCAACSNIRLKAVVMKEDAHHINCPNADVCGNQSVLKPGHADIVARIKGEE